MNCQPQWVDCQYWNRQLLNQLLLHRRAAKPITVGRTAMQAGTLGLGPEDYFGVPRGLLRERGVLVRGMMTWLMRFRVVVFGPLR